MAFRIVPLTREHRALVRTFRCQHESLNAFLHRFALRHLERDLLSRTYLAIDDDAKQVGGYFSLTTASVDRDQAGRVPALDRLPRFPVPALLLARLAVDGRIQGQGLGRYLFDEALGLTLTLARTGPVRFRLLVTDAVDDQAVQFYEHFGLAAITRDLPCRMVLDLRALLAD